MAHVLGGEERALGERSVELADRNQSRHRANRPSGEALQALGHVGQLRYVFVRQSQRLGSAAVFGDGERVVQRGQRADDRRPCLVLDRVVVDVSGRLAPRRVR